MTGSDDDPLAKPTARKLKGADAKIPSPTRVAAFQTGLSAESRASAYLIAKGYRILARRYRTPYGEIDIVARRRNLLAFIEVKARANLDDAAYSVTPQQQQRIVTAAQAWLMNQPDYANFDMRFDVVLIAPRHLPHHLMAAFDASV
jgi:putative endonuclease